MQAYPIPACGPAQPAQIWAHYGIALPEPQITGAGTQQDPFTQRPGSGTLGTLDGVVGLSQVLRPAETALIYDGITMGVLGGASGGSACHREALLAGEAASMHRFAGRQPKNPCLRLWRGD